MSLQPEFELFAFWRTSATYRVRVALNLKGLIAHERIINLDAGEQRSAAFLAINPMGAIPALVEPGQAPLTQSLAILEFLDEMQPSPALLPTGLHARARVRSLAAMLASDTHPLITPRIKKYRHFLPRRYADHRRHLPGQHCRGCARLQDHGCRYSDRRPDHGQLRST
jgi:maleylacetoacetate isomerase